MFLKNTFVFGIVEVTDRVGRKKSIRKTNIISRRTYTDNLSLLSVKM